jgi:hypothetical protein
MVELANEFVGLPKQPALVARTRGEALDDAIGRDPRLEGDSAAVVNDGEAVLLHERQDPEDLACGVLMTPLLDLLAVRSDVLASSMRAP